MPHALSVLPYDLPDAALTQSSPEPARVCVFAPSRTMLVIGKGSDPERELHIENILADGVPVLRRASGGCAVVLTPDMLAIAFSVQHSPQLKSSEYFRLFNAAIIHALEEEGIAGLAHAGTSDIALSGRKIAGTAIYRNCDLVFYHAILNVAGNVGLMERYLRTPPREPAYRAQRSHADFVTSLCAAGFTVNPSRFERAVHRHFHTALNSGIAAPVPLGSDATRAA